MRLGIGDWGLGIGEDEGDEGDKGRTAITNYQSPITNYPMPHAPCPMPHAPCPIPIPEPVLAV
ncbi:hypothetical protein [Tolypothrix sp. PCC 7601]|uniref:hypothetical protein n=1 Tax=Tolypothrix sp. PCC 7601 TaxID=1188 RepID=UPI000906F5B5|nr:hypothetical protein [Tolypothrix sp. PCC 7601]